VAVSRLCKSCGLEFAAAGSGTVGRAPVYCSPACRLAAQRKRNAAYYAANLEAERARGRAAYVTRALKGACSECGKPVQVSPTSAPPDRRRCRDCQRARPKKRLDPRVCELCECTYVPKYRSERRDRPQPQRWCSKSCTTAWRMGARPPYDPSDLAGLERKARLSRIRTRRRAETWDGVTDAEIMERDRWRCGICRKAIGKSFRWPDPRSKSIDHIVPLSEGGDDAAGNKRAAHLGCNCARMNRGGGEQAALF